MKDWDPRVSRTGKTFMRELISFAKKCSSTKHGTKCEATAMVDNGCGIIYTYVAHKPDSESSKPDSSLVRDIVLCS